MVVDMKATSSATWTDFWAPRRTWASESWPMSSVPIGWASDGGEENSSVMSAYPYFQKRPPMSEMMTITTNTTRLPTASLWAMKRRMTIWVWLRRWTVNSRSVAVVGTSWTLTPCSVVWRSSTRPSPVVVPVPGGVAGGRGRVSVIADPRVQHRVQHVRDEIEQHHDHTRHHQPGQQDIDVVGDHPLDQQGAHALPGEHPLGDDGPAEHRPGVDGHHRDQRDEGVAECVAGHHPRPRQPLGSGQPDVVGAEHVEHGGPLVARPGGEADQGQGEGRQDEVARPVGQLVPEAAGQVGGLGPHRVDDLLAEQ